MESDDLEIVKKQLGRNIENFHRVVRRCSFGFPVVIESLPEKDGVPFPTLYWLTCPHLRREVSRLESSGWISRFEKLVEEDERFRERLLKAHEIVKKRRDALAESSWVRKVLSSVGSGGLRNPLKVKCLHLHLADFLAGVGNPIGERVWSMIEKKECDNIPAECAPRR